jgi:hypothetical protein
MGVVVHSGPVPPVINWGHLRPKGPAMFEIWRHRQTDQRYLVAMVAGEPNSCAGPLASDEDLAAAVRTQAPKVPNPQALMHLKRKPHEYEREDLTNTPRTAERQTAVAP